MTMCTRIEVLYDQQTIRNRIRTIADFINKDYEDKDNIVLLCVLKGASHFFSELSLMIETDQLQYEFVGLSSYEGTETTGNVKLTTELPNLKGKHVIIVEDIVDTGISMQYLKRELGQQWPLSVKICTLLDKPSRRKVEVEPDYVVFEIPDYFVVGYGLDYNEQYRNLPYIGTFEQWS